MAFLDDNEFFTVSDRLGKSFSGTGDIFASVTFSMLIRGKDIQTAINTAAEFIVRSVKDTLAADPEADHNYGIEFEKNLGFLIGR
jgi:pyridoxine kinase